MASPEASLQRSLVMPERSGTTPEAKHHSSRATGMRCEDQSKDAQGEASWGVFFAQELMPSSGRNRMMFTCQAAYIDITCVGRIGGATTAVCLHERTAVAESADYSH